MSQIDPYKVLNIPRNASREEIEAAYRRAVNRFGPDAGFNPMYAQLHTNATTAYQMLMTQPAGTQPAPEATFLWGEFCARFFKQVLPCWLFLGAVEFFLSALRPRAGVESNAGRHLLLLGVVAALSVVALGTHGYFRRLPGLRSRSRPLLRCVFDLRFLIIVALQTAALWATVVMVEFRAPDLLREAAERCLWPTVAAVPLAWLLNLWQNPRIAGLFVTEKSASRGFWYFSGAICTCPAYAFHILYICEGYYALERWGETLVFVFTVFSFFSLFFLAALPLKKWGILE